MKKCLFLILVWLAYSEPSFAQVVISELSAFGSFSYLDYGEDDSDWIEIENRGGQSVNLRDWSLSDDANDLRMWVFPEKILFPDQRVTVFASGKDGVFGDPNEFHTNFRLNSSGETVFLNPPLGSSQLSSELRYPEQRAGYTYGLHPNRSGTFYLDTPTPGQPNQSTEVLQGVLSPISYLPAGGIFEEPVLVQISKPDAVSEVYYTLDNTDPNPMDSLLYENPFEVTATHTVRAAAFRTRYIPSPILTQTYWIGVEESLQTLPVLSFVFDPEDLEGVEGLRGTDSEGNPNAIKTGPEWERPVAVQYIDFNDPNQSFTINAGARMHGNNSRRTGSKPSFRIYFRDEYGSDKLPFDLIKESPVHEFDALVIRGGHQDATNPFIQDELSRRLFSDMGQVSSLGTFVHLLINGNYYGYYNPVERYNVDFFQQKYDSNSEWDVVRNREIGEGSLTPFLDLFQLVKNNPVEDPNIYREVSKRLDLVNFVDYLLLNVYGSTWDWPGNNVTISHESTPSGKVRYHVWDAEGSFGLRAVVTDDTTMIELLDGLSEESNLFLGLTQNPDFNRLFASRFRKHFYEGGALTDAHIVERFLELRGEVIGAIPSFIPTVTFAWTPHRRHYMIAHLYQHGLIQAVNQPVSDRPPQSDALPTVPFLGPASSDLNGDGRVNAKDLSSMVGTFRENPRTESFGALIKESTDWEVWSYPVGKGVRDIAFADLDQDSREDLVAVNGDYGQLLVLRNLGGGLFGPPEYLSAELGACAVAMADVNGDGFVDVLIGNDGMTGQTLSVFLNDGQGHFSQAHKIEAFNIDENEFIHIRQIHLADFDQDKNLDILIGFHSAFANQPNVTAILFGDGTGSFSDRTLVETGSTRIFGAAMSVVADIDGDHTPEAVVLDGKNSSFLLSLDETHQLKTPELLPQPGSFEQFTLDMGDMDQDGFPDLVFGDGPNGAIRILFNSGSGVFSPTDSVRIPGIRPENIHVADLNGDDLPEIIACNPNPALLPPSTLQIFWNEGNRQILPGVPMLLGGEVAFPGWVASSDIDQDGDGDVGVSDELNGRITVFLNHLASGQHNPDINRDGNIDLNDLGALAADWQTITSPKTLNR